MVEEKNPNLSVEAKDAVSKIVGIGAVKYADMVRDRNNDYVFSWDGMLAMVGNTAPYLQYAHARISSIFRKGDIDVTALQGTNLLITHAAERALILKIIEFSSVVQVVAVELRPHHLCTYLYELASAFSSFYDACSVLNADDEAIKQSRLFLCQVTRKTLASGLDLLGIIAPEEM
jgi:arginyl-tRNA synthetase